MNGIIVINKEKGWTSNDIVQKIKHSFNQKTGHTGTLDPMATGVLPILVGKGTLLSKYLIKHDKEYEATIKLGQKTDTADSEGRVIEQREVAKEVLSEEHIKKILETFEGKQKQIPPLYSAIKVNGKKLYEYARKGQEVEITPREIKIYNIELISLDAQQKELTYKVSCSKGTYIRTLSEDIASKLGTVGYMKELKRTQVGEFSINEACVIDEVISNSNNHIWLEKHFITIEQFFKDKKNITLEDEKLKMFLNGVKLFTKKQDEIYKIYNKNNEFIGIGVVKNSKLKRDIII